MYVDNQLLIETGRKFVIIKYIPARQYILHYYTIRFKVFWKPILNTSKF